MWGVSIDLSAAYHHMPVAERHTHFLAFQVGEVKYKYVVMDLHTVLSPKILSNQLNFSYNFSTAIGQQNRPHTDIFCHKLALNRSQIQG